MTLTRIALISMLTVPLFGQYHRGVNLAGPEFSTWAPGAEGQSYTFNSEASFQYFANKGLTLLRIPFKWEQMQPQLGGDFDPNYLSGIWRDIGWAKQYGMLVVLDLQNFGGYSKNGVLDDGNNICPIDQPGCATTDNLADFWVRMSNQFMNEPTVYAYDLMNEPHTVDPSAWHTISQTVLQAIRNNGDNKLIMVPGGSWSGALSWWDTNGAQGWINDPANNFEYEAHFYFDMDGSGAYNQPWDDGVWDRALTGINNFVGWCNQNGARCYLGEYGVPDDDTRYLTVLDAVLSVLDDAGFDGTYWAAGEWWGDRLNVQPTDNFTTDRPQLPVLLGHLGL